MRLFTEHEVKFYRLGIVELCLSMCPRQAIGFYHTWKHYHNHLLGLNFFLGKGRHFAVTIYRH